MYGNYIHSDEGDDMNAQTIAGQVKNLPALPTVMATGMLAAQGFKPSTEERAAIRARADFFESLGMTREVNIPVVDTYTSARIGTLVFNV